MSTPSQRAKRQRLVTVNPACQVRPAKCTFCRRAGEEIAGEEIMRRSAYVV